MILVWSMGMFQITRGYLDILEVIIRFQRSFNLTSMIRILTWIQAWHQDLFCLLFLTENFGTQVRMLGHQTNWGIQNLETLHELEMLQCLGISKDLKRNHFWYFLKWGEPNSSPAILIILYSTYIYIVLYIYIHAYNTYIHMHNVSVYR